jgi:hypothetical protein
MNLEWQDDGLVGLEEEKLSSGLDLEETEDLDLNSDGELLDQVNEADAQKAKQKVVNDQRKMRAKKKQKNSGEEFLDSFKEVAGKLVDAAVRLVDNANTPSEKVLYSLQFMGMVDFQRQVHSI